MANGEADVPAGTVDDIRGDATAREERAAAARAALEAVALPVGDLNAALPHLRRPFAAAAIKFKVQNVFPRNDEPKGCIVIAYIDARLVVERLNAVVGEAWTAKPVRVAENDKLLMCEMTVCGVQRIDIGASSKGMSKDLWSDALKRAAVPFGVAVSVYALPEIKLFANQPHVERREVWDPKEKKKKPTLVLADLGHVKLREGYSKWLVETGEPAFGPVLDHGDVPGVTNDPEDEEPVDDFAPALPAALTDERAVELQEQARALYAEISAVESAAKSFPPAMFNTWLAQSSHSHEALERLVEHVRARAVELLGGDGS